MNQRQLPFSPWFLWSSPVLWNGQERNKPRPIPEMTDEDRENFWAAYDLVGMEALGE